jgi:LmbE family N-acetylglucosaminyl deacetylase/CheY-like chemotaxis protein
MGRRARVLVVEDDDDVAAYVCTVLERRGGMEASSTPSALDALSQIARSQVDVLVTDVELPGMTGLELVEQVRTIRASLPIVILTGHASLDYAVGALRLHVDDFLLKPVPSADLVAKVRALATKGRPTTAPHVTAQTVLAIGAHPDDIEVGVGGLLASHRAAGDEVVMLTLSRRPHGSIAIRQDEMLAAAELLGARLFLEDFSPGRIPPGESTESIIERVVAEVAPTVVYTHSAHERNVDHHATYAATVAVARTTPGVTAIACYQSPWSTVDFRPNRFPVIDEYVDAKLALLGCYGADGRTDLDPELVLATARYWSRHGSGIACEPLEVVRESTKYATAGAARRPIATVSPIRRERDNRERDNRERDKELHGA